MTRKSKFEAGDLMRTEASVSAAQAVAETAPIREVSEREAREIMGDDFFGTEEVQKAFGYLPEHIPPIPFSAAEVQTGKEKDMQLILQVDRFRIVAGEVPFTIHQARETFFKNDMGQPIWTDDVDVCKGAHFYENEMPRVGWRLVSKKPVAQSDIVANPLEQVGALMEFVRNNFTEHPKSPYASVVAQWDTEVQNLLTLDTTEAFKTFKGLDLSDACMETAVEAVYRFFLNRGNERTLLFHSSFPNINRGTLTTSVLNDEFIGVNLSHDNKLTFVGMPLRNKKNSIGPMASLGAP